MMKKTFYPYAINKDPSEAEEMMRRDSFVRSGMLI